MSNDIGAMMEAVREMWNTGDTSKAAPYYLPSALRSAPNQAKALTGVAEIAEYVRQMRLAFPDARLTFNEVVAGNDCQVVLWTFTGTQQGDYLGIPVSGKAVSITGVTWVRLKDGMILSEEVFFDNLTVLQALGALPAASAAAG